MSVTTLADGVAVGKDQVICDGCAVRYPVKQGLPILIIAEAELPEMKKLPCLRNRS